MRKIGDWFETTIDEGNFIYAFSAFLLLATIVVGIPTGIVYLLT